MLAVDAAEDSTTLFEWFATTFTVAMVISRQPRFCPGLLSKRRAFQTQFSALQVPFDAVNYYSVWKLLSALFAYFYHNNSLSCKLYRGVGSRIRTCGMSLRRRPLYPSELYPHMVWAEGLEPSTNRVEVGCSIHLSYAHILSWITIRCETLLNILVWNYIPRMHFIASQADLTSRLPRNSKIFFIIHITSFALFCNAFIQSTCLPQQVALHETYFLPKGVCHAGAGKGTRTPTPLDTGT